MTTTGRPLSQLFEKQAEFQKKVTGIDLPVDSVEWSSYHALALVEEVGEVLKADKRWKTHRNTHYDPENKLEELADTFITVINIAMYSGFGPEALYEAVVAKISKNTKKLEGETPCPE